MNPQEKQILVEVLQEWFPTSREVIVQEDWSGQKVLDDGTIVLGCKAGPEIAIDNLFHEMGHLVEIDNRRVTKPGWGLKFGPPQVIMGRIYRDFTKWSASPRELRVFAYQANLMSHYGLKMDLKRTVQLFEFINDYLFAPCPRNKREEYLLGELTRMIQQPEYSFESFKAGWQAKMKFLATRRQRRRVHAESVSG